MSASVRTPVASAQVFLAGLIDYAGLFPPASLDMMSCVRNYSRYLKSQERWALGRYILPVARMDEFLSAKENVAGDPWKLSGILSMNIVDDLAAVDGFNRKARGAVIDAVELRVRSTEDIELAMRHLPATTAAFFEIELEHAKALLPAVRRARGYAKLRTGGVVQEAFPAIERIAEFLTACAELGLAFKATAGLHHPLRCMHPLTYETNASEGLMHGFLNLFTAATIAWSAARAGYAVPRDALATCLADEERANWHFDEHGLTWSGEEEPVHVGLNVLRTMRSEFALSFGSCSFEEPIADLRELDLL